jgi:hypothetical protein
MTFWEELQVSQAGAKIGRDREYKKEGWFGLYGVKGQNLVLSFCLIRALCGLNFPPVAR